MLTLALCGFARWRFDPVTFGSAACFKMVDHIRTGRWSEALADPSPLLLPMRVASLQWLGKSAETAGLIIALIANLRVLLPLTAIARITFGEAAASATGFLWAIHPLAIRLNVQPLTDAPTAFLVALALWAGLRALEKGSLAWILGAGVDSGLAHLIRPEGNEAVLAKATREAGESALSRNLPWRTKFDRPARSTGGSWPPRCRLRSEITMRNTDEPQVRLTGGRRQGSGDIHSLARLMGKTPGEGERTDA